MTFNTHKIPEEIKIGYQKINVESYIPNPLWCYKCQRFGHHQDHSTRPPVCRRCGEYDINNDCQKECKCANCQGNHGAGFWDCEIKKKEKEITKHTQNTTYPEVRRMVETTKYMQGTKKYPNNQQTKLSYVWNKHNHKTQGGCLACKRNESTDPGDGNCHRSSHWKTLQRPKHQSCNKPRETGKGRQEELRSLHF